MWVFKALRGCLQVLRCLCDKNRQEEMVEGRVSHGVSDGGSESSEAVSCSAMHSPVHYILVRGISKHVSAGFVDSSTEKSVPGVGAGNGDWVHVKCG